MARILVIDDEQVIRDLIVEILEDAGHQVEGVPTAEQGLERIDDHDFELVVSDIVMPGLSGLELLETVRQRRASLPVVLVTGAGTHANVTEALGRGADGIVMKPFSHAELQRAVVNALDRADRSAVEIRDQLLTPIVAAALANAIEARDASMQGHCERLGALAHRIGAQLGLDAPELETLRLSAILHDVGKIGIPDRVLTKNGAFTQEERAIMRTHPLIGDKLLAPLDLLGGIRPVARHHHERWDGNGYPDGLSGEEIPLYARIVALADSVEAMSADRVYREQLTGPQILAELRAGRGTQWDPALVDTLLGMIESDDLAFGPDGLVLCLSPTDQEPAGSASVLLVEDDSGHAVQTREALQNGLDHVAVTHARDAATAEKLCASSDWSLIVLDHPLAGESSLDLVSDLHTTLPDVPIVMLTSEGSSEVAVEAFRRGASDYVVKSNGYLVELTDRVKTLLGPV